jgi:long-chain acyl-CoA synthetase
VGVSVGQILRQAALRAPDRVGVCDVGHAGARPREHTYAELDLAARRIAAALVAHGVRAGQCVALCGENTAGLIAAWFGIVYAGAVVVPVPILSAPPELAQRLKHARCGLLLHDAARAELASRALASLELAPTPLVIEALLEAPRAPSAYPADTSASATAMILYTSGTTGSAKGAEISHASLMLHTSGLATHALRLGERDVALCALPLTHSYGCRIGMLAPLYALAKLVITPRFEAARVLELLRGHGVTWLPVVPTMLAAWNKQPAFAPLPALRWVLSAGAPLSDALALRAEQRLGTEVRQGFGMTEATFASMNAPPDARVLGSVGKATWGVELRIVDAAGCDVPRNEPGQLLVRGHNVMTGYLHEPAETEQALVDGFMHSGDVARLDADGRLWIVDRTKDLVIRGGYNVYPSELEAVLAEHPAVAEVAVIGRPDETYGEEVLAVLVLHAGATLDAPALDALAATRLSRTKLPREYARVDALPLGASGKVQKRELRAWWSAGRLSVTRVKS